jgi:hypothetical protein
MPACLTSPCSALLVVREQRAGKKRRQKAKTGAEDLLSSSSSGRKGESRVSGCALWHGQNRQEQVDSSSTRGTDVQAGRKGEKRDETHTRSTSYRVHAPGPAGLDQILGHCQSGCCHNQADPGDSCDANPSLSKSSWKVGQLSRC